VERVGSASVALFFAATIVVACGNDHPPAGSTLGAPPPPPPGGLALPGCGQQSNGGYCECVDAPIFFDPPNMYFVLDRSRSMADAQKWTNMQSGLTRVVRDIGPRANIGAFDFPGGDGTNCNPGDELMKIRPGDPVGELHGPTLTALTNALAKIKPAGGTPTAAALGKTLAALQGAPGRTFVVLATDGGPNCNSAAACDATQCMANIENQPDCPPNGPANCCTPPAGIPETCLDAKPTIDAVTALFKANVPTFVVGPGGVPIYASLLDDLATAGGTAKPQSPKYYSVDSSDATALATTLKQVAARIVATCTYKLTQQNLEQDTVNVYFDETVVARDVVNGWTISGDTVTLVGNSCAAVMNGDVLDVRIVVGCPTVLH
jgi:hypothetical protein